MARQRAARGYDPVTDLTFSHQIEKWKPPVGIMLTGMNARWRYAASQGCSTLSTFPCMTG